MVIMLYTTIQICKVFMHAWEMNTAILSLIINIIAYYCIFCESYRLNINFTEI